ncbi:MAG TPA: ABC transporter substrate-binding protein [Pseudonocardiaceae bacterium]|jgi:peptide/nickel transport system substrate-binding protein
MIRFRTTRRERTEVPRTRSRARTVVALAAAATVAVALPACAQSQRGNEGGAAQSGGTLTFGAAGAPDLFDPFYANDGETFRVSRQIFEGLVGFKPGGSTITPELATDWSSTPDGKTWTFNLRTGVKFQDGTDFNGDAVCANFDRWYNQTGAAQNPALSFYWHDNFGGFADHKEPSLFDSCQAQSPTKAVVKLTRATGKFPSVLAEASFAMQSPTAMKKYDANNIVAAGDSFTYPAYAQSHPTGTGPFVFDGYDKGNGTITLKRNENYWGPKAKLDKLIFRIIPDEKARLQALQAGDIDGYDLPNPADWQTLQQNFNLEIREPFNILYLGFTQKNNPALQDLRVRQALAYAIDRKTLVSSTMPEHAEVAREFYPPSVEGYSPDVQDYPYDPQKARDLLKQANASNLTVNFYWPTEVTRPYMPDPRSIFGAIQANLQAVGVKVNPISKPWNGGYLDDVDNAKADLFLLGWTGDYNSPDNFIGTFFGSLNNRFWLQAAPWGQQLGDALRAADGQPDQATRVAMYQDINRKLMSQYLPGVPIAHAPAAIVVTKKVKGLVPSPITAEEFAPVSISNS